MVNVAVVEKTPTEELSNLIRRTYMYFADQQGSVYLPDLIEMVYWDYHQEQKDKLLEAAIDRGDHELYSMTADEFTKYIYNGVLDIPWMEPALPVSDVVEMISATIAVNNLFFEDYEGNFVNSPLCEVW